MTLLGGLGSDGRRGVAPHHAEPPLKRRRDVVGLHFRGMPKIYLYMSQNITVEVPLNSMPVKMKWDVSELCLITA